MRDYAPVTADEALEHDARWIVRLAIAEDVGPSHDWTTECLIGPELRGECWIVPREDGVCAGLVTLPWIIDEFAADLRVELLAEDGDPLVAGQPLVRLTGGARDLLTAERTILNFLCRLCGVASLTAAATTIARGSLTVS
jgi:nicotinate-nucleotide pyrophosphorylase (carboxylating)